MKLTEYVYEFIDGYRAVFFSQRGGKVAHIVVLPGESIIWDALTYYYLHKSIHRKLNITYKRWKNIVYSKHKQELNLIKT